MASPDDLTGRWVVDAMNVIGCRPNGWWRDRHGAMLQLVRDLERWAQADGRQVTVVFEQPPSPPIRSEVLGIAFAPVAQPNSADDEIVRLVVSDAEPRRLTVVTSDTGLAGRVRRAGASVQPAAEFRRLVDPG